MLAEALGRRLPPAGASATMAADMQCFFGDWFFYGGPGPA
jgi:hypothetical protein